MNEEEESKSWIEKLRDREIGTELRENVVEGIKFGANWIGTKALELLPEEDQKWWNEVGWPHLQSEWEYKTNRSRNMTGPLNMTGLDAFALLTSPSWAPYALKGQILSHITRIDPDLTTIFGAGLRPKHLGISQKVTPYNPLQLKGSKPVDFNKGSQIINEIFDRPKFNQNIVKGPFVNWQSQNVPFGQTSPNITKEVYDVAKRTDAQGMGRGVKRNTPDRTRDLILQNRINPTIEELEQAVVGPGIEGLKPKPTYIRPAETPLVKARNARPGVYDWTEIGKRLQKKYGGTDGQVQAFIQLQLANKKQMEADLVKINEKAQFDYLEFAATAMEALDDAGYPTGELTDDDMYKLFITMASNPKAARVFDKGHIRSAKNIWRETKLGTPTSADYRSNLAIEQKASIRDFMRIDPKTGEAELIIPGNIKRGSRTDAPKIVDMLRGTSPNVDIEYQRFLEPEFDEALTDIVPFQRHGHFMEYLRGRIKKWQGRGKDRLIGKQQLDQYRGKLNEFIDDYLNEQELGEWELDDKVKSDFIDDIMRNRKPLHSLDLKDEKDINKLLDDIIFRRITPEEWFLENPE